MKRFRIASAKGTGRAAERIGNCAQASGLGVTVLRGLCGSSVLLAAQLLHAADFLKQLTPKDFKLGSMPSVTLLRTNQTITCAVPLNQVTVQSPDRMDPSALPNNSRNIDKEIVHRTPIPVCARPDSK